MEISRGCRPLPAAGCLRSFSLGYEANPKQRIRFQKSDIIFWGPKCYKTMMIRVMMINHELQYGP